MLALLPTLESEDPSVLDALPDPVVRFDRDCRYLWVNRAATEVSGRSREAYLGQPYDASAADTALPGPALEDAVRQVFERGELRSIELRYDLGDGERWYESRIAPETDADGVVRSVLVVARDITRFKRAEQQLADERHALGERVKELRCLYTVSRLLEAEDDALAVTLQRICDVLPPGWQFPEITVACLEVDDTRRCTSAYRSTPWQQQADIRVEGVVVGHVTIGYLEERAFLEEERALLAEIAARIGEGLRRRRAEATLARRNAHYKAVLEATTDVIALIGADLRIQAVTRSAADVLGREPDELVGGAIVDLVHPDDWAAVADELQHMLREPTHLGRVEYRLAHADGSWRTVESIARNLLDDPVVNAVVTSTRDLTARRQLESQLQQAQKMEALGRLAGGIAHDFNNVLTAIESSAALLDESFGPDDPRREDTEQIREAVERAARMTRHLSTLGRKQATQPQRIDVAAVLRDMHKMLQRLIGEDIDLRADLTAAVPAAFMDPVQVEQIVLNLVVNAREAMPQGGRLSIGLSRVRGEGKDDRVGLEVRDTGVGMSPDVLERVFDPFFSTKATGTGLGLATVYAIVKQNGGTVAVETEPGQGTTFRIELPAVDDGGSVRPPEQRSSEASGTGKGEHILLVEDDPLVRRVAERILSRRGYTVHVAPSGPDALELLDAMSEPIDLLLADVVMPLMSGRQVAEELCRRQPGLRVVFMSGYIDDATVRHGVRRSTVAFVSKPFTADSLARAVRSALDDE